MVLNLRHKQALSRFFLLGLLVLAAVTTSFNTLLAHDHDHLLIHSETHSHDFDNDDALELEKKFVSSAHNAVDHSHDKATSLPDLTVMVSEAISTPYRQNQKKLYSDLFYDLDRPPRI